MKQLNCAFQFVFDKRLNYLANYNNLRSTFIDAYLQIITFTYFVQFTGGLARSPQASSHGFDQHRSIFFIFYNLKRIGAKAVIFIVLLLETQNKCERTHKITALQAINAHYHITHANGATKSRGCS